ncbi:hypothetical protein [Kitasatospora sp. NPDC088548]|uniref:hypothetical protein n=1 Tax=Kitasatospora sp. NPDC088548 TaxID=3364075 RepID=UPI00381B602B
MLPKTVRGAVEVAAGLVEEVGKRVVGTAAELLERTGIDVTEVERRFGGQFPPSAKQLQTLAEEAVTAGRAGVDLAVGVARGEVEKAFERVGDQVTKVGVVLAYLESRLREVQGGDGPAGTTVVPAPAPRADDLFGRGWEQEDGPAVRVIGEPIAAERVEVDEPVEVDPPVPPARPAKAVREVRDVRDVQDVRDVKDLEPESPARTGEPVGPAEPAAGKPVKKQAGKATARPATEKPAPAGKAPTGKTPTGKTPTGKASSEKAATDRTPAAKAPAKKAAAKKTAVKKTAVTKSSATRRTAAAGQEMPAKRTATRKTTVRKTSTKKPDA